MKNIAYKSILLIISLSFSSSLLALNNLTTYLQFSLNLDDIIDDNKIYKQFALISKWTQGINRYSNVTTRGKFSSKQYQNSDVDDRNDLELQLAYHYQVANGYFSPVYTAQFIAINSQNAYRYDTNKLSLAFIRKQPISNVIELSIGFKTQKHSGTENRTINSFFLNIDLILSFQTLIYLGLNIADENIDLKTSNPSPTPAIIQNQSQVRSDDISSHHSIVEQSINNPNANSVASDNTSLSIGIIYQIDNTHTFDLLLMKNSYKTSSTLDNTIVSIDYFYKF